jgi:heat shock protein HtpX
MAMNFWEAQRRARSNTTRYLVLFILMTIIVACGVEFAMRDFVDTDEYNPQFPILGVGFAAFTFGVAGFQYFRFRVFGGSYVAESLGAWRPDPNSNDLRIKQLHNIVEEIAVASALPIPAIYVMDNPQINAFAAGLNKEDAAITVTTGCLQALNRDELQGVIAHEFGHISNGDMKISMRLAAMVMGFFFVLYFALRLMQFSSFSSRDRDGKQNNNPIMIAALILMVAGAITWFFGSLLKAAVSREREYLADASAVQFTRNPDGISNALIKISQASKRDNMPSSGLAYSHLYFDEKRSFSSLFATHPPLEKRISAIKGRTYIPEEWGIPKA